MAIFKKNSIVGADNSFVWQNEIREKTKKMQPITLFILKTALMNNPNPISYVLLIIAIYKPGKYISRNS